MDEESRIERGKMQSDSVNNIEFILDRSLTPKLEKLFESAMAAEDDGDEAGISAWEAAWQESPGHPDILDALEKLFEKTGKWTQFADFLKKQMTAVSDEGRKINLMMMLARIYDEHMNQDVMVVSTYQAIIKLNEKFLPAINAAIEKYEKMERWPDLVKMMKLKGDAVTNPEEKVGVWLVVAKLFLNRFSNQAETIKAFEEVLAVDPYHGEAIEYLKDMYEKRRDWEKLVVLMEKEVEQLPSESERTAGLIRIAELTTERIRRPEVCIQRWEAVLESNPENTGALGQLAALYERTKEWEKLATILSKQLESGLAGNERLQILQKLGQVYGDKAEDGEKAVEVWKELLAINPSDRRAEEQLKKRYLALQDWAALEEFYSSSGKWDEFIRVLEREADRSDSSTESKIALQFKIAELWRDQKSRIDRAARCYEAILALDADNLDAAEAFIPILEESKDAAKLADVLGVRLAHLDDPDQKLALIRRIAAIADTEIGDKRRAFDGYLKAFVSVPNDETAGEDLERLAGEVNGWETVVATYEGLLPTGKKKNTNIPLKLKLARVLDEELGQQDKALEHYGAILAEDPKNSGAVAALEKLYAHMGRYEELLDIYARRLEMAEDDTERREILYNQALLWEEEVKDNAKAIDVLKNLIATAGDEPRSLAALDRLYSAEENWPALVDVIKRQLALGFLDSDVELDLKYRLGQVSKEYLNDAAGALSCYREILMVEPGHEGAVSALEALLSDEECQSETAQILATYYEENDEWDKLVSTTEILVRHAADSIEKYDLLLRIGMLYGDKLMSPERAFVAYSRAFRENIGDAAALEKLETITTMLDCWSELVSLLADGGKTAEDTVVRKDLWLRAARIYETQLDDLDKAVEAYAQVLELDGHNLDAIEALESVYNRTDRWAELIGIYKTKVEITSDIEDKEKICLQMAMIYEEMLESPNDAILCLKEVLTFDSANAGALKELDKLFVQQQRWTDLADNLLQQISNCDAEDEIVGLNLRLAELREIRLGEVSSAIEIFKEVLAIDSENSTAIEALERIIENAEFQRDVAEILEPIYEELGAWGKLIGVYKIMVETDDDAGRIVGLLHKIAGLYENQGDEPEKSFQTLGKALAVDPADERTQDELERLARILVLYAELAELYSSVVGKTDNYELKASYHLKIARIYEEQLQNMEEAVKHYRAVLEVDPMHLEAVTALEGAYQVTENYEALAITYLRKVEMVEDTDEQKALLFKASQIYEDILENPEKAVEVYRRILEIDEDDLHAIMQIESLYLQMERWEDLQEIYNKKVELVETPEEKREVLYVLGAMYEREVGDTTKAINTYQRVLEFDPDDVQSVQRLDVLYSENEEWHDLLSILEREVELADDPDEAVSFKYRIGELYVQHLDDLERAIEYFNDILTIAPDHQPTLSSLEELIKSGKGTMQAADVLEPIYQNLGEWRKLIGVFEVKLNNTAEAEVRVELLHQIAELLESDLHLDSPGEAFDVYARALTEDPMNERTLTKLEDLASQSNRWRDLAKLFDDQLAKVEEPDLAISLGLKSGAIYEESLNELEEAVARYQKVLALDDSNPSALLRLDQLFQLQEKWQDLTGILEKEALIAEMPEDALELRFRMGQIFQRELSQPQKAIEVYRDILTADPTHESTASALELLFAEGAHRPEIAEVLEPIYRMHSEWEKLASLYGAELEDLTVADERVSLMHRIAELQEERAMDAVEAFNWYCKAFSEAPLNERSLEELERLAGNIDGWVDAAELYQDIFVKSEDTAVKVLCAKRLALVAEEQLHDIAKAEQAYRSCLELGDDDVSVLTALDRIYTQYMEWERLTEILKRLSETVSDTEEKVAYIYRLGVTLETELVEVEQARECFHKIVDKLDPKHLASLERLETIYADKEDWKALFDVYARMNEAVDNESESADLYAKMATLASECLEDIQQSGVLWGKVLEIRGEDTSALEALAQLYSRQENWSDLVDVLERAVSVADDDETRVRIYSQLGTVWGECLNRDKNALENWENALGIDPENMAALKAIAAIHEANKEWGRLLDTLDSIINVGASTFGEEELKQYYAKQGNIYADILDRPMDAIDSWRNAHDVDPSDLTTFEALEKLYLGQEMWEEMVALLGEKSALLEGQERIDTLLRQAEIFDARIEAPLRAKSSYTGILEVDPLHDEAFAKLVVIETEECEWEELTQYYYGRLNYVEDVKKRVEIYHAVADIFENRLDQPDNAFIVMQRAFEEDYTNDKTADHLERLASLTGNWQQLLAATNQVLATVDNRAIQISLCLKIGKWYAEELANPEYAIACYQRVLQLDNENAAALQLTGKLYRANKQWDEYVEVLKRAVEFEEDEEKRKQVLVELGETYEEYLQDIPEARNAYKKALALDPGLEPAIEALERILGGSENWKELIPVLRRKLEVLSGKDDIIATHLRIGEIFEENLEDFQSAVEEYRKALDLDEAHAPALKGLERLYQKLQRWQDLMDILEIQLQYAESERERIGLLVQIAQMLEKEFLKPDQAASRYEEVLSIDLKQWDTLEALERIYKQTGRWQDLVSTLERHIEAVPERVEKIPLYEQVGAVWANELKKPNRAIEVYREILDIDPDSVLALDELSRLQSMNQDWAAAHDTLKRLADTIMDPGKKVDLYYRLGKINEENLLDRNTATEHFRSALDIEPGHLPSLESLRKIHVDEGDWVSATRVLEAEQEYTENDRKKSKLQYELGSLFASKLNDEETAVAWYERALQSDGDNVVAAEPLVNYYVEQNRFKEADPLLDMLIRLGQKRSSQEMQELQRKSGLVSVELGNLDKALKAYQAAYDLDTSHLPTLLKLADIYYRKALWDKAFKFYQMVLVHHREKQKKEEIVDIFYRLGHIKAEVKERRKALNMFDKALEIDSKHKDTLREVILLHDEGKNYEQVIHFKKELLDAVEDDERFDLMVEIGDIWHEKLRNPQKAISSYNDALEVKPHSRPVLHKVLPLYQSTKQWQKVVETIQQVADMEEDSIKLGRLYYSIGVIYRDEIKNADEAVECFNRSLDASLENLKAFEAIDRILTQRKDWKNLERAYRKMLHRIAGKGRPDLEINLWHFLGEIYRTRMNQYEPAAEAFKMASKLDPDNLLRHEILAELYVSLPNRLEDAIAEYQWMIKQNPYSVDSYKALRKLYFENRQYDKAWCLCATLSFLKKADAEEQQFFEQYRTKGMIRAQSRLDNESWLKWVFHPDESIFVGKILEVTTNVARSFKVQPPKAFGLKKGQKRPVNDNLMFAKTFFYAAQVLNIPMIPELYVQDDKPGGLNFAVTEPMASVCGAGLLTGYSPQDLLFIVTKHLNYYRPEHYIRWVFPTHGELKTLLLAAMKIGMRDFKLPDDKSGVLEQYVKQISSRIQPMEVEALGKVVRRFIQAGENIDVKKWINAVELTGCRAGFLMCNDLEVAARMIQAETATVDEIPPKEKIKELVVFSVSEEYFKLRAALGITISN